METARTELSDLGEFGLIDHIQKKIKLNNDTSILGIGDDGAVISSKGSSIISTDLLLEGVHFDLSYCPLKHLGYKAAVVNFSDIYAMNAFPEQLLISLGVSNRFSVEAVDELYSGILLACERYGVDLIGGDTSSSQNGLVISATAFGQVKEGTEVRRSTAKEKELICVTGDLGAAYIGLQILNREKRVFKENPNIQPNLEGYDYVVERQLKPEAQKELIHWLSENEIRPTAMIDVSDGLASEILHLCQSSKKGASIYIDKLPIDQETFRVAEELNLDPITCALNGGEDYELLFTIAQKDFEKVQNQSNISVIGHIMDEGSGANVISQGGQQIPLQAQGWNAFLKKDLDK
ncbi:MAG: thiamine-phosphate kinase [Flavobacteriales bacterium]|nr:thiamine-phosphate kinase [Flavobacteriales bacterium]